MCSRLVVLTVCGRHESLLFMLWVLQHFDLFLCIFVLCFFTEARKILKNEPCAP